MRLGARVNAADILASGYDCAVLATGGMPGSSSGGGATGINRVDQKIDDIKDAFNPEVKHCGNKFEMWSEQ